MKNSMKMKILMKNSMKNHLKHKVITRKKLPDCSCKTSISVCCFGTNPWTQIFSIPIKKYFVFTRGAVEFVVFFFFSFVTCLKSIVLLCCCNSRINSPEAIKKLPFRFFSGMGRGGLSGFFSTPTVTCFLLGV